MTGAEYEEAKRIEEAWLVISDYCNQYGPAMKSGLENPVCLALAKTHSTILMNFARHLFWVIADQRKGDGRIPDWIHEAAQKQAIPHV